MRRRDFLAAGCACCAGLARPALAAAAAPGSAEAPGYAPPARFQRPELASDEGGLWAMMDREERKLRRSPFRIADDGLQSYLQELCCRLAGDHCPDVRSYAVRTPYFNANMAPNGMMQVWSGLLLRVDNEAQLAAVLGHEVGHYLQRHTLDRLRDTRTRAGFSQFLGLFGYAGLAGNILLQATALSYSRDQEREADRIGAWLMHRSGYDVHEASRVWQNLLVEMRARDGDKAGSGSAFFSTHPASEERRATLEALASSWTGGESGEQRFRSMIAPHEAEWVEDEIQRGQVEESVALFSRHVDSGRSPALMLYGRGEVRRLRNQGKDAATALTDFEAAAALPDPPPGVYRGIGLIQRGLGNPDAAQSAFRTYLARAGGAPDAALIQTYLKDPSP